MPRSTRRPPSSVPKDPILRSEMWIAIGVFTAMCVVVLLKTPQLLEPDDYAYRASIVALSEGHVLLSNAQYIALLAQLDAHGAGGIEQWVHLARGSWISQKNPGYPFFAVGFQWFHVLRWTPLFYGGFACCGLFYGARRWLGRWGGTYAVVLYCTSGAALNFAWRATMPTFTDASLIAGAAGLLLGVLVAKGDLVPRRLILGLIAFLALEGAVLIRYTDVTVLLVAVIAVIALRRVCVLSRATVLTWMAVVIWLAAFGIELNHLLYGGTTTTGYPSGLITFGSSAILPNLGRMPQELVESMPMLIPALASMVWIVVRLVRSRRVDPRFPPRLRARQDAVVALVLAAGWFSVWALYSTYTWTVAQTLGTVIPVHVVRFYVPALGLIALLAAWFFKQLPWWFASAVFVVLAGAGVWSYQLPANHLIVKSHSSPFLPPDRAAPVPSEMDRANKPWAPRRRKLVHARSKSCLYRLSEERMNASSENRPVPKRATTAASAASATFSW
jgi:hypothetical protein